jgi:hypothetical protein
VYTHTELCHPPSSILQHHCLGLLASCPMSTQALSSISLAATCSRKIFSGLPRTIPPLRASSHCSQLSLCFWFLFQALLPHIPPSCFFVPDTLNLLLLGSPSQQPKELA